LGAWESELKKILRIGILLFSMILPSTFGFADDIIRGHSCYTYGDKESLLQAREITRSLAIRNAIESYRIFITSTGTVKNFQLTNDFIRWISAGYLKDIKVIEHTEEGRTICEKIECVVSPQEIENILKEYVKRMRETEQLGVDNNGYLQILQVGITKKAQQQKEGKEYPVFFVKVKVLKRPINPSEDIYFNICIDYHDQLGEPRLTNCWSVIPELTEIFARGRKSVIPGQIITSIGPKTPERQEDTYKVWLPRPEP
jgi:hypothetical protein